VVGVEVWKD
jgi:hypothetical protein